MGAQRRVLSEHTKTRHEATPGELEPFDRQIRAFGSDGQRTLRQLSVAVVGVGGTGSLIAQQLVHLGVRRFVLIDPDKVELTNTNRLANATLEDLGQAKVEVARRYVLSVAPNARAEAIVGDVTRATVAKRLVDADFVFGCTDSHGSRAVLQQVAYQYLVPCIDMGTVIATMGGALTHANGRVQMLAPGLPCLSCSGLLDSNEIRRDMMTEFERRSDPYILGARVPAPAVMSLNATVASLAVTMFMAAVTAFRSEARHLHYSAISSSLRQIAATQRPDCFICSSKGALARGDSEPFMARNDSV